MRGWCAYHTQCVGSAWVKCEAVMGKLAPICIQKTFIPKQPSAYDRRRWTADRLSCTDACAAEFLTKMTPKASAAMCCPRWADHVIVLL